LILFLKDFTKEGIEPIIEIPEQDLYAIADEKSLNRILNILISNSLKYGSDGKVIGITLREDDSNIFIDVFDRGKGIPHEQIPLIFDRLYTVEKSRNKKLSSSM